MAEQPGWATTHDDLLVPIEAAARRYTAMVATLDGAAAVPRSDWTVADTTHHLARGAQLYARYLSGDATPDIDLSDVAGGSIGASNARRLAADDERDTTVLCAELHDAMDTICAGARLLALDAPFSWHGRPETLRVALASMIAELLIHGRDVAAVGPTPWPLTVDDAATIAANIAPLFPLLVNPATTAKLDAVIRVQLRRGPQIDLAFDHGTLSLGARDRRPAVTVSADPVTFLLVAYGRASQWPAIARGRLLAWGRRPWLALRLTRYLVTP